MVFVKFLNNLNNIFRLMINHKNEYAPAEYIGYGGGF